MLSDVSYLTLFTFAYCSEVQTTLIKLLMWLSCNSQYCFCWCTVFNYTTGWLLCFLSIFLCILYCPLSFANINNSNTTTMAPVYYVLGCHNDVDTWLPGFIYFYFGLAKISDFWSLDACIATNDRPTCCIASISVSTFPFSILLFKSQEIGCAEIHLFILRSTKWTL